MLQVLLFNRCGTSFAVILMQKHLTKGNSSKSTSWGWDVVWYTPPLLCTVKRYLLLQLQYLYFCRSCIQTLFGWNLPFTFIVYQNVPIRMLFFLSISQNLIFPTNSILLYRKTYVFFIFVRAHVYIVTSCHTRGMLVSM